MITQADFLDWLRAHGLDPSDVAEVRFTARGVRSDEAISMEVDVLQRNLENGGIIAAGEGPAMRTRRVTVVAPLAASATHETGVGGDD